MSRKNPYLSYNARNEAEGDSKSRVPLAVGGVVLAAAAVAGTLIAVGHYSQTQKREARIARNEKIITQAKHILDGTVYLGKGVNVRDSMTVDYGDSNRSDPRPANSRFTVGEGKYAGKLITITRPIVETDKNGDKWLAFDDPETIANPALRDEADHLGFLALSTLEEKYPGLVVIEGTKDGSDKARTLAVDYVDAGRGTGFFENAASDQQINYALTSTAPLDTGK